MHERQFSYKDVKGTIFLGVDGWGGRFKMVGFAVEFEANLLGPEIVKLELEQMIDLLIDSYYPA